MKNLFILSMVMFSMLGCRKTDEPLVAERTIAMNRIQFEQDLKHKIILDSRLNWSTENMDRWQGTLWAAELMQFRDDSLLAALKMGMKQLAYLDPEWQRSLLEAVFGLYPDIFREEMSAFITETPYPKLFAMAVNYLIRESKEIKKKNYLKILFNGFPDWQKDPILYLLASDLADMQPELPELEELLAHGFLPGIPVIFSFQRSDRRYPGLTILRDQNGYFLRNQEGELIGIPQLSMAVSNMPGYLTNGNTPQGLFVVKGTEISNNVFIGPTRNLQLRLPYEADLREFTIAENDPDTVWTIERYRRLLPSGWQSYLPVFETYYAGKAGRTEIIAHGTTINPEFYQGQPFYPYTPSLGCLTTLELWSPLNGHRRYSDQERLIRAYRQFRQDKCLYLVINLDDQPRPVVISDLIQTILTVETKIRDSKGK